MGSERIYGISLYDSVKRQETNRSIYSRKNYLCLHFLFSENRGMFYLGDSVIFEGIRHLMRNACACGHVRNNDNNNNNNNSNNNNNNNNIIL